MRRCRGGASCKRQEARGSGQVVMHTYDEAGMYTAVVTATNALGSAVAMTTVTVEEVPEAGFLIFLPAVVGKP